MTENRAGLRLVVASDYIPPTEPEPSAPVIEESYTPRYSTRRYIIVFTIIAIWCSLLALAAYNPAK
jgi:hypothetical protein